MSAEIQSSNNNEKIPRNYVKNQMTPEQYSKLRKLDRHKRDEYGVKIRKQRQPDKYKKSVAKLTEEQQIEKKRIHAENMRNHRLKAKVRTYEKELAKLQLLSSSEMSEDEMLKNQEILINWNVKKNSSPEEIEKVKENIEKLSPVTLRKSVSELNDAQEILKMSKKKGTKKNIEKELKKRQEKLNEALNFADDAEAMAFQKAISYLKKTVFHPAEIVKLIDQHSSTLNVQLVALN